MTKFCRECGRTFTSPSEPVLFCSDECQKRSFRRYLMLLRSQGGSLSREDYKAIERMLSASYEE